MGKDNVLDIMREHLPMLDNINDKELAKKVAKIWHEVWKESKWEDIEDACFKPDYPGISLLNHIRSVTQAALKFAETRMEIYGEQINIDILLAGALLHDVSKVLEFEPTKEKPIATKKRILFQHGVLGAHKALNENLPDELVHIIICHTGKSRLIPKTPEALIIYYIDGADAELNSQKFGVPLALSKWK